MEGQYKPKGENNSKDVQMNMEDYIINVKEEMMDSEESPLAFPNEKTIAEEFVERNLNLFIDKFIYTDNGEDSKYFQVESEKNLFGMEEETFETKDDPLKIVKNNTVPKSKENDIEYILPYGWKKIYRTRKNTKRWDVYVIAPCGKRFRSNVEINDYINSNPQVECDLNVTNTKQPSDVPRKPDPKSPKEKSLIPLNVFETLKLIWTHICIGKLIR